MKHSRTIRRPRGAILVVALACLAIAAAFYVVLIKQVAMERRELVTGQQRLQASWLAEAGIERAASRLVGDSNYQGETWAVAAVDLGLPDDGLVTIAIEPVTGPSERSRVRVEAHYPHGPREFSRYVKEILVDRGMLRSIASNER